MAKKDPTLYYQVKNARATAVKPADIGLAHGREPPSGEHVLHLDGKPVVIYGEGNVKPFPLAAKGVVTPGQFGPEDLKTLEGPYLPRLFRRALALGDETGWNLATIITVSVSGGSALLSLVLLIVCIKAFRSAGLL